jgi:hypothetical protein
MTVDTIYLELEHTTPEKIEKIKKLLREIGVNVLNIFKTEKIEEEPIVSELTIDEFWKEIDEGYREIERGEYVTQEQLNREVEKLWM